MSEPYRSLYSVIPARVRDDRALRPNAKLLYGELSALAQAEGYCWASNAYLADRLGVAAKTIEGLMKQLKDQGHVQLEVERDINTNEVLQRKIWICGPPGSSIPPPLNFKGTSPQKQGDPPLKNEDRNNKYNNTVEDTSRESPLSPPAGGASSGKQRRHREPKAAPDWKPERFEGFWRMYPLKKSKQAAIRAWDLLRPDDRLLAVMGRALQRQLASPEWQRKLREEGGQGIPYPATWINGRRWEDEAQPDRAALSAPPGEGGLDCGFR